MSVDEENADTKPSRQANIGCIGWSALFVIAVSLVTWVVPNQMELVTYSTKERAHRDLEQILNALNEYAIRNAGQYPESLEVLVVPDKNGDRYFQGPRLPLDPWKQRYHYEPPSPGALELVPHVWSYGKDGQLGGDDDIDSAEPDE